jgi:hypothetical protein
MMFGVDNIDTMPTTYIEEPITHRLEDGYFIFAPFSHLDLQYQTCTARIRIAPGHTSVASFNVTSIRIAAVSLLA